MKATLTALICLLLTGCTGTAKQENAAEATAEPAMIADANFAGGYTLGNTLQMSMIHGHYTADTHEVFAIVLNPKHLSLTYGRHWELEKWENGQWIVPKKKKEMFFFDDELILPASDIFCFSFPIKYYEITPGKYRIAKPLYQYGQKINLKAEFDIE